MDIDGVLRNIVSEFHRCFIEKYPERKRDILPMRSWDFCEAYPATTEEVRALLFREYAHRIFGSAKAYPGARRFMKKLNDRYELWIVTSQSYRMIKVTLDWLEVNGIKFHSIAFTSNKDAIDVDVLLDDYTYNLENFEAMRPGKLSVCMNRGWNQDWKGSRVHTFDEFIKLLLNKQKGMPNGKSE